MRRVSLLADIGAVHYLFGGAGLLSLLAFGALILAPTMGSFGRGWEKAAAAFLSLFVLAALMALGFGLGVVIVYYWDDISGLIG
jgi:hypothetical protein